LLTTDAVACWSLKYCKTSLYFPDKRKWRRERRKVGAPAGESLAVGQGSSLGVYPVSI
jgi:hypothetical protein